MKRLVEMGNKKKKEKRKKKLKFLKKLIDCGIFLLIVLTVTFILNEYVIERTQVHNHSMEPTLSEGDVLLTDKLTYKRRDPKRYEIVIFKNETDGEDLIKRVIGLPGETVRIVQGKIYIDGENIEDIEGLDKPFDAGSAAEDFKLGEDEYFVLGDNREVSIDSRVPSVGAVSAENIIGKALIRIKPLSKFRIK